MNTTRDWNLLTINAGSSSLKVALYQMGSLETCLLTANVERIGSPVSRITIAYKNNGPAFDHQEKLTDHSVALAAVLSRIENRWSAANLDGIEHRIVLGDSRCREPLRIDDELLFRFQELADRAPDHLPQVVDSIAAVARIYPDVPQVACFDSAFHRQMPRDAHMFALPRRFFQRGVMRYGFHGLSCEYVMQQLIALDPVAAKGRVLIAHLGNGASITAVHQGVSVDTSMGFTPLAGLVMGTRCGDVDPGALVYLMKKEGMTPHTLNDLLNKESGLLGLSGYSADMRDLLDRESTDPHCAEAIAVFCYQARKFIGAYSAALGGLDTLVFTGGIGEHGSKIRARICNGLEFIGVKLDADANTSHAPVISATGSAVTVRIMRT
ncbi:MAG TPA: acetate/propionate family kinase [Blastocatellia bacterium]|nr:acetate/propionate family kinase [Blastocatellia bacterium]